MADVLTADRFEAELARYLYERSEEARAVRVGEKEVSEQAAIVARYAHLFTRGQHDALRVAGETSEAFAGEVPGFEAEHRFRLREACAGGIMAIELAERSDALENAILACRVEFAGERLPLRAAQAKLAVVDDYGERDELGGVVLTAAAAFNEERLSLMSSEETLDAELSGEADPIKRSSNLKAIDMEALAGALERATSTIESAYRELRERWLDRILGPEREPEPLSAHVAYVRRLSPLAVTYTKERSVPVCLASLDQLGFDLAADQRIHLDLEDRPQKNPRACVIASDPPRIVHLITRAQGGLADYQAFLHEAGHALHYAGCDPSLAYAFRRLSRDHARADARSYRTASPASPVQRASVKVSDRTATAASSAPLSR